eukprot:389832-Rhodomonas_salina.1
MFDFGASRLLQDLISFFGAEIVLSDPARASKAYRDQLTAEFARCAAKSNTMKHILNTVCIRNVFDFVVWYGLDDVSYWKVHDSLAIFDCGVVVTSMKGCRLAFDYRLH